MEKKIEFYLACPSYLSEHVKHHFEHHYKSKSAGITLERAEISDIQIPKDYTEVCDLKLSKNNIFSIDADHGKHNTPISFLLNCIHDVRGNDMAKISICAEPFNRMKWNSASEVAHGKFQKGKTPKRMRINGKNSFTALFNVLDVAYTWLESLMNDVIDIVDSIGSKEKRTNYHEKQRFKQLVDLEKKKIMIDGKLSTSTDRKKNAPVFKTHIRIASHSINDTRREMTKRSIVTVFDQLSENNELKAIELPKKEQQASIQEINNFKLSIYSKSDTDTNIFSNYELGKLTQLPTADLQREYENSLVSNRRVETEVPAVLANDKGIMVGHSEQKGVKIPISIPLSNLDETFRSYGFVGSPRMGKDTLMKNMIVEGSLNHGISTVLIDSIMEDGERGLADGVRDALPPANIIDIDLSDEEYFPPMDLTEIVKKLGERRGADRFANELIDFFGDIGEMGQSRAILRTFAKASQGSIHNIKLLMENEDLRTNRIKELRANGQERLAKELDKWTTTYKPKMNKEGKVVDVVVDKDGQKSLENKAGPILSRLEEFLGTDSLFNIFSQDPHPDLDFERWMKEGKVIILRIPNRKLGPLPTKTLAHWITLKVFMTKLLMGPNEAKTFIVFNEPHQYLTEGLKNLMQRILLEGPKWRLSGLFAFHHFKLLKYGLDEDMKAAGINWFLFANDNKKVYEDLSEQLKPSFDVEVAMQTEAYHSIVISRFNGRRQNPFLMKALAPPSQRYSEYDNSFLTKRHARQYGRHWKDIERMALQKESLEGTNG
ncbi:ATP-binding protein [Peribacillus frigoritolerans]|uniref:ATP-binding protein n=1 Tax=Peribacillus frigoritolerans TaxID=450367 RepID=UPI003D04995F